MGSPESKNRTLELIESVPSLVFTTICPEGYPHARAVSNLCHKESYPLLTDFFAKRQNPFTQWIVTSTSSEKLKQLRKNPKSALYYCQANAFHGLMLGGDMEIIEDPSIKKALWQEPWKQFYTRGPEDPEYAVLCFKPISARGWHWDSIFEFDPRDPR